MTRVADTSGGTQAENATPPPAPQASSTAPAAGATATGGASLQDFAVAILAKLGYPQTPENIQFLISWMNREGTAAAFNPLATTQRVPGSSALPGNSAGVQQYGSFDDGVSATVKTLLNGHYTDILAGLKSGDAAAADAAGKMSRGLSTWSGGGYSTITGTPATNNPVPTGSGKPNVAQGQTLAGQSLVDYAESNFPQYAYLLNDPEVGPILVKAAQDGVTDPNILAGMLRNTNWWKQTSVTARSWNKLVADDPATADQAISNTVNQIGTLAAKMGVQLSDSQMHDLAVNYQKLGWTNDQLTQQLSTYAKYSGGAQQIKGQAGTVLQQLQNLYASYILPVSAQTLQANMQDVLSGKQTVQDFGQRLAQQAKSLYGNNADLAAALDRGETTAQFMQPYADYAQQILGPQAGSINWLDPKWNVALTGYTDPSTGKTTPMGLAQWGQTLRTNPTYGFDTSPNAVQTASQFANELASRLTGASI